MLVTSTTNGWNFRYILIGRKANGTIKNTTLSSMQLKQQSYFSRDSSLQVSPPTVNQAAISIYEDYINIAVTGGLTPKLNNLEIYKKYASLK